MSDHLISVAALCGLAGCGVWQFQMERRMRRVRRALAALSAALLVDSTLATELVMETRKALGKELVRHSLNVAEEVSRI